MQIIWEAVPRRLTNSSWHLNSNNIYPSQEPNFRSAGYIQSLPACLTLRYFFLFFIYSPLIAFDWAPELCNRVSMNSRVSHRRGLCNRISEDPLFPTPPAPPSRCARCKFPSPDCRSIEGRKIYNVRVLVPVPVRLPSPGTRKKINELQEGK